MFRHIENTDQLQSNQHHKRILVAPLNWGLGHATRCIPIIKALLQQQFQPIIASDGMALSLLKKEFPSLKAIELPSYNIKYSKDANTFKYKILKDAPHLIKTINAEKRAVQLIAETEQLQGIISDNRFGVRHETIPSVFISHQVRVLSGSTTWLSTKLHQRIISKFNECWVPDFEGTPNLSGCLGHDPGFTGLVRYIGPLSRFNRRSCSPEYDLLVLLSGPEPQRSMLSTLLLDQLKFFKGRVCFVKGLIEENAVCEDLGSIKVYNFLTSTQLENVINASTLVLSRSGYTTIMDLVKLQKKAFFIPTPGQFEQEYLANQLHEQGIVPSCKQEDFTIDKLEWSKDFSGFQELEFPETFTGLFNLFEGKRELTTHT